MKIKGQYQWTDYLAAQLLHIQPSDFSRIFIYLFRWRADHYLNALYSLELRR
jgi:hypothetical protein